MLAGLLREVGVVFLSCFAVLIFWVLGDSFDPRASPPQPRRPCAGGARMSKKKNVICDYCMHDFFPSCFAPGLFWVSASKVNRYPTFIPGAEHVKKIMQAVGVVKELAQGVFTFVVIH